MRISSSQALELPIGAPMLDQARLNIASRCRTSRLPWRGQFSPELVEYLLKSTCPKQGVIYDPFCGSGTVLFESLRRGHKAWGSEVNPAAWHFAQVANAARLNDETTQVFIKKLQHLQRRFVPAPLFDGEAPSSVSWMQEIFGESDPVFRNVLAATFLLGMGNNNHLTDRTLERACKTMIDILSELSHSGGQADCFLGDARQVALDDESVDAVITSPPYINVFNYHQNFRPAVELLGWRPLQAAKSEIGANRKHRMNRFLTVVQYCLDMSQALGELARVMRREAPLVIVLGRTSSVLGASFKNGDLIRRIAEASGAFVEIHAAERVFTSRFGERIFEDIIICRREKFAVAGDAIAREIGVSALMAAAASVPERNSTALKMAISMAEKVLPSRLLEIDIPAPFDALAKRGGA